jgi:hypothetical protein
MEGMGDTHNSIDISGLSIEEKRTLLDQLIQKKSEPIYIAILNDFLYLEQS